MVSKAKQGFAQDAFGNSLAGCPLEVRISEMNLAKTRGCVIGALAIVCADNPLCASTGHRICKRLHEVLHLSKARSG